MFTVNVMKYVFLLNANAFDDKIFKSCMNISQCKHGEKCIFGKCRIPALGGPCNNDLDCPAIGTCKNSRYTEYHGGLI